MNAPYTPRSPWLATLAWVLLLLLVGSGLTLWGLSRWQAGAQLLGVVPPQTHTLAVKTVANVPPPLAPALADPAAADRLAALEARLGNVESKTQQAAGSVGRADALLVAFASRRAIDRGVQLGYLETLLAERFGGQSPVAVATIITASRSPVTLDQLINDFGALEAKLRGGGPDEGLWQGVKRELGSIVAVRRSSAPSPKPEARYNRALARLEQGQVDVALAETMRLPGAASAAPWIAKARRYVAAHRALDEVESSALLTGGR
ncbi:MAG: hypothetical protein ABIR87_06835 [Sphingomicrobium sp.]